MLNTKKFLIFLILICSLVGISSAVGGFEDNLVGWSPGTAPFVDDADPDAKKAVYIRTDEYYAGAKCAQITAWAKDYDYATMYLDYAFAVNFDNVDEITYYVKTDDVINHDGTAKFWCQIGDTRYTEITSGGVFNTWTKRTIDTSTISGTKQLSFVSTAIAVSGLEEKYSMLLDNVAIDGVLIPYGFSNQRFYVYDSNTNLPIENALVTVPASAEYSDYTNSAGVTDYFSNLVSLHTYSYNVQKTGYNTISTSFTTGIESSLTTNVALTSTTTPTPTEVTPTPTPTPTEVTPTPTPTETPNNDLIPTMSDYTIPSGLVFGGSEFDDTSLLWMAFDDITSTNWFSGHTNINIGYKFDLPTKVTDFTILPTSPYGLKTFSFEGSNDGTTWNTIYSHVDIPISTNSKTVFYTSNNDYYYYYRLSNMQNTITDPRCGIVEIEMFGVFGSAPTPTPVPTTPTPTPIPDEYNPTINNPSNLKESIIFAYASVFGISDNDNANLIFAAIIIGFFAMMAGYATRSGTGILAGACIGFVLCLGLNLIPIWIFFAIVVMTIIFFVLKSGGE